MLIHGVRIFLDNRVIGYFDAEQFLFYLNQLVYMLHQLVCQLYNMVLLGLVVVF